LRGCRAVAAARHVSCLGVAVRPTGRAVLAGGVVVRGPALRLMAVRVW